MSSFEVLLTDDARRDLEEIHEYITSHDSATSADYVLEQIELLFRSLETFPERGNYPQELLELGIREYRERFFKPYRVMYRIIENRVYVMLIADGRRDMRSLLEKRLISGS